MKYIGLAIVAVLTWCAPVRGVDTINLTIVTNGPGMGAVTGGGSYPQGSTPTVEIAAFRGSYIKAVQATFLQPSPPNWAPYSFNTQLIGLVMNTHLGEAIDLTVVTNDTETLPGLTGDAVITVTFGTGSPAILEEPISVVAVTGTEIQLQGTASGRQPMHFQWVKDGLAIEGATNAMVSTLISDSFASSLVLTNAQESDSGLYTLNITNIFGATNCSSVSLVVKGAGRPNKPACRSRKASGD